MSVKITYKQQVDAFCDEKNTLTAEEMLRIAKERISGQEQQPENIAKVIDLTEQRKKRSGFGKVLSAACIIIVCTMAVATTALAATGKLGDVFRMIFKDETSANLVEQGYYYEVNQSASDGIFQIDLLAVTGDAQTPKLVFDIWVDDPNITLGNEQMYISAYTLGVEQYENELDQYGMCEGSGYRDAENTNLYHVVLDGAPAWISYGETVVISVREIRFRHIARPYMVNVEYRLEVPPMDLHPVVSDYLGGVLVSKKEDGVYLNYVNYGAYYTELIFVFDYDGQSLEGKYTTELGLESLLQMEWRDYADDLRLVVDGVEYEANVNEGGYVWYDKQGEAGNKNRCYVAPRFPAIDYLSARKISLKQGDTEYRLK
jgi:hypothetical protein